MVAKNPPEIFSADCACPILDQIADCDLIFGAVLLLAHLEFLSG
jgi:hypothetical protein